MALINGGHQRNGGMKYLAENGSWRRRNIAISWISGIGRGMARRAYRARGIWASLAAVIFACLAITFQIGAVPLAARGRGGQA